MRRFMRPVLLGLALIGAAGSVQALSDAEQARYQALIEELRCLVCQNQSIAESNAGLADDLRRQVFQMIEDGQTDAQIKTYVQQRYGDFVLYQPPFKPSTWLLWGGPFVLLLVVLVLVIRLARRRASADLETSDAVDRERMRSLLERQ